MENRDLSNGRPENAFCVMERTQLAVLVLCTVLCHLSIDKVTTGLSLDSHSALLTHQKL